MVNMATLRTFSGISSAILLVTCFATSALAADDKEAFKKADSYTQGCKLIPYEDLNEKCYQEYSKQTPLCTGEKERGCGDLDKDKDDDRELAKERRDNAVECIAQKNEVASVYDEALRKLKDDESNSSDPDIRSLASSIIKKIEDSQERHKKELENIGRRRDKCDDVYNKR